MRFVERGTWRSHAAGNPFTVNGHNKFHQQTPSLRATSTAATHASARSCPSISTSILHTCRPAAAVRQGYARERGAWHRSLGARFPAVRSSNPSGRPETARSARGGHRIGEHRGDLQRLSWPRAYKRRCAARADRRPKASRPLGRVRARLRLCRPAHNAAILIGRKRIDAAASVADERRPYRALPAPTGQSPRQRLPLKQKLPGPFQRRRLKVVAGKEHVFPVNPASNAQCHQV